MYTQTDTLVCCCPALLGYNQSVVVSRKDPESRKKAVAQIKQRLTSNGYWPQVSTGLSCLSTTSLSDVVLSSWLFIVDPYLWSPVGGLQRTLA